jgi:hypothetical protein
MMDLTCSVADAVSRACCPCLAPIRLIPGPAPDLQRAGSTHRWVSVKRRHATWIRSNAAGAIAAEHRIC